MKNKVRRLAAVMIAALGLATLRAEATDAALDSPGAEIVTGWNQLLQSNIPSTAGLMTPRYFAILHIAMFDAVDAIEHRYTAYHARLLGYPGASPEAAAAQAGHDVLVALIPTPEARAIFDAALQAQLANLPPWRAALGAAVGRKAASQILAWRATDGSAAPNPPMMRSDDAVDG